MANQSNGNHNKLHNAPALKNTGTLTHDRIAEKQAPPTNSDNKDWVLYGNILGQWWENQNPLGSVLEDVRQRVLSTVQLPNNVKMAKQRIRGMQDKIERIESDIDAIEQTHRHQHKLDLTR